LYYNSSDLNYNISKSNLEIKIINKFGVLYIYYNNVLLTQLELESTQNSKIDYIYLYGSE
jgi:hypothetical protein